VAVRQEAHWNLAVTNTDKNYSYIVHLIGISWVEYFQWKPDFLNLQGKWKLVWMKCQVIQPRRGKGLLVLVITRFEKSTLFTVSSGVKFVQNTCLQSNSTPFHGIAFKIAKLNGSVKRDVSKIPWVYNYVVIQYYSWYTLNLWICALLK